MSLVVDELKEVDRSLVELNGTRLNGTSGLAPPFVHQLVRDKRVGSSLETSGNESCFG